MKTLTLTNFFQVIHLSGAKTAEFLQSQLTNDVKQADSKLLQWQAYCNRQGLVHAVFSLWGNSEDYYLLLPADLAPSIQSTLQKYAVFSKVKISILPLTSITLVLQDVAEKSLQWSIVNFDQTNLQIAWQSKIDQSLLMLNDDMALRALFIAHHFPWLCAATQDCFRPHDINLPELGVISFSKGCYPGQEIIARMHYRGKPKQGMYIFDVDSKADFTPGQILLEGERQIGQVVDAININDKTWLSVVLQHEASDYFGQKNILL